MINEFIRIAKQLNRIGICPVLMGSLGLEWITHQDWQARDIDIHVPGDSRGWQAPDEDRIYQWDEIMEIMQQLGYVLVDLHEHEFQREGLSVEFGCIDTLPDFAGVEPCDLPQYQVEETRFYVPNQAQYLAIYRASSQDSYRNEQNNDKDFAKISYLEKNRNER